MPHFNNNCDTNTIIKVKDYTLITGNEQKPVTLVEVKDYLKIDDDDSHDTELTSLIDSATNKGEQITGRDFLDKTYKGYLDCFPFSSEIGIQIQKSKLQSITSIQYLVDEVLTTFDSTNYYTTDKQEYAEIWLFDDKVYPTDIDINRRQAVEITFLVGYGDDPCDVPEDLKRAILGHIALLFENKGDCMDDQSVNSQIIGLYMPYVISRKLICPI